MKVKPNKALSCYLKVFGTPDGHRVLRDLMNNYDYPLITGNEAQHLKHIGSREVIDFIRERLVAAGGSNRKPFADIMNEVNLLNLYE